MRNVVLLCLDTVRKDYFDRFATRLRDRADVVYEQCRTASSWSAPSHASMFTGELPSENGVHAHNRNFFHLSKSDTFFDDLPEHRALGFSANAWASSTFGFDRLFDEFSDVSPDRRFPDGMHVADFGQRAEETGVAKRIEFLKEVLHHDHPLQSLANGAYVQFEQLTARAPIPKPVDDGASIILREVLKGTNEEPFVSFGNIMDAHGPLQHVWGYDRDLHDAPMAWSSGDVDWSRVLEEGDTEQIDWYRGLYGAAIDYLDRKVCAFVREVNERTELPTTVVVTGDHGDNLGFEGDDGTWGHVTSSLSESLNHVPLVVLNAPGEHDAVVDDYVSHLQLGELTAELATGSVPDLSRERIAAERVGYSGLLDTDQFDPAVDRAIRCVYEGNEKYCWDSLGETAVYDLDPERPCWERAGEGSVDVSSLEPEFFDLPIREFKQRALEADTADPDMDQATMDRLRDLGYV